MAKLLLILCVIIGIFSSCKQKSADKISHDSVFDSLSDTLSKRYIDSIAWTIDKSIPLRKRGFPSPKKGNIVYHEERPFVDSVGNLIKYTLYEYASDTFQSYRNYYFYQNMVVYVSIMKSVDRRLDGMGEYYFKDERLIDSTTHNLKIPPYLLRRQGLDCLNKFNKRQ